MDRYLRANLEKHWDAGSSFEHNLKKPDNPGPPDQGTDSYPKCNKIDGSVVQMYKMEEVNVRLCLSVRRPQFGLTLYVPTQVQANTTICNIVFYDQIYFMDAFIPIHKGGVESNTAFLESTVHFKW
jgi:hypothetical protein